MAKLLITVFAAAAFGAAATGAQEGMQLRGNPVRKVVNLLQRMQEKVEDEGKKDKELHDQFMCYCSSSDGSLKDSVDAGEVRIPELESVIKQASAKLSQLGKDIEAHKADKAAAKTAMAEADGVRRRAEADFQKEKSETTADLKSLDAAVAAIEKGLGGAFLQSPAAATLRAVVAARQNSLQTDTQEIVSFLSGTQDSGDEAPGSSEVLGIMKQMRDEMAQSLAESTAAEEKSVQSHQGVIAAKKKETAILTKMIEQKLGRSGELGVLEATKKNELEDTKESLAEDKKFMAELEKNCEVKAKEFEQRSRLRAQELAALADTIKVLNDDDALELFKKTLPSGSSFLQVRVTASRMRAQALRVLSEARGHVRASRRPSFDFIALALRGKKKGGFDQVIKMVDELVATLKAEQAEDEKKKDYCEKEFDLSDDKKKALQGSLADLDTVLAEAKEGIANLGEDSAAIEKGIKALDAQVSEATAQRKKEHAEYKDLVASNTAAKELLKYAKNRLAKFYDPKMYKAPKRDLSEEDRISVNMGGTMAPTTPGGIADTGISFLEVSAHSRAHARAKDFGAPPPPPETAGAYSKKTEEKNGVLAMIDLLIADLEKELTVAGAEEKEAQADYEATIQDAAAKRADDAKSLTDKEASRADLQASYEDSKAESAATAKELGVTKDYILSLHHECDFLLKYFDVRKEARAGEVDALGKAKAVLNGADFSFVQTRRAAHRTSRGFFA